MPKIEKESDTLRREYKHTVDELEHLFKDTNWKQSQVDRICERQQQIIRELEECTGVKIHQKTIEEILAENRAIEKGEYYAQ